MEAVKQQISTLQVRLEEELHRRFKAVCARKGVSMSTVARDAIEFYVKREEERERVQ